VADDADGGVSLMGSDFASDATLAARRVYVDPAQIEQVRAARRRAARALASNHARDAADCALLLEMLGLTAGEGKQHV
jgi:hypothetical protein